MRAREILLSLSTLTSCKPLPVHSACRLRLDAMSRLLAGRGTEPRSDKNQMRSWPRPATTDCCSGTYETTI